MRIPAAHGVVRARRAFATPARTSVRRAAVVVLPRVVVVAPRVGPRRRRCAVRVRRARLLAAVCVCVCVRRLAGVLLQLLLAVVQGRVGLWRWEGLLAAKESRVSFKVLWGERRKEREKARTLSSPSHTRLLLTPSAASPCSAPAPAHSSPFPIALAFATPFASAITPDPVPDPLTRALRLCAARLAGTNGDPPFPFATLCESADPDPDPIPIPIPD